jgi:plasmid maintenance system antidote protein VapI
MGTDTTTQNFKNLVGNNKSNFIENAKISIKKNEWRKRSQDIALIVLERLDELSMKQNQLADLMHVTPQQISKIVKGYENLTLESISKIEKALGINLISINQSYVLPEMKPITQKKFKLENTHANNLEEPQKNIVFTYYQFEKAKVA